VRRIEAITGDNAVAYVQEQEALLSQTASAFKAPVHELPTKIAQILDNVKMLEKELARLKSKLASSQGDDLASRATEVKGVRILATKIDNADAKSLRELADKLRDKLKSCVLVLGAAIDGKVALIAAVTPDLTSRIKAGDLVNHVATQVGGKGGGKPDMAQAGGVHPEKLDDALTSAVTWISSKLG
jgi:alanyl-tRNA synthetase